MATDWRVTLAPVPCRGCDRPIPKGATACREIRGATLRTHWWHPDCAANADVGAPSP